MRDVWSCCDVPSYLVAGQLPVPLVMLTKLLNDGALWLSSGYDRVRPSPVSYIKTTHFLAVITFLPIFVP
jgi:hypothetical protein